MRMGRTRFWLILTGMLAACEPSPPTLVADNAAPPASNAAVPAAPDAQGEPQPKKSIIRPTVYEPEPAEPRPQPVERIIPFPDRGVKLDETAMRAIDQVLDSPAARAGGAITLRGHSDSRGSDDANLAASKRRAEAVAAYMEDHGVAAERITIVALGENRPMAPNARLDGSDDPEGRAKNRRVAIEVAAPAPDVADDPST